ncbi:MAG: hypothetical protein CL764_04280 [Chloroflexi bacterium]|nr:hypothetical protein [Chloroflexota bacterium]|tara:strand:+ start:2565 stop:3212 length:648 start_codon:yes stop_codon:yes gene_type:complete
MNYITEFKQLSIKNIQPSSNHLEDDYSTEEIKSVALDIKEKGLMEPLLVSKIDNGNFEIILGIKRYLAFKHLGYSTVVVGIINEKINTDEAWALSLKYPSLSELLSPTHKAIGIKFLIDHEKMNLNDISNQTGIHIKDLNRYLTIFKFDKKLKKMLENNEISLKISVLSHNLNKTLSKLSGHELPSITSSKIAKNLTLKDNHDIENLEKIINIFD